ncbi:MAG: folylpolyglutamate synthase/dihydrofolate synthase family protein [Bacteroidota bacterium]
MKFGLTGIRRLLRSVGNPEKAFPSIHVAGTNGKGSTAAMIAAALSAAGYKTGLYTSPHLVDYSERIQINGKPIQHRSIVRIVNHLWPEIHKHNSTFFEVSTALAFKYFADSKIDLAVVETGLGGRLDATNVLKPLVTVITTIGLEHREILGDTLAKIAREKAGIIKRGVPCFTGVDSAEVLAIIQRVAARNRAALHSFREARFKLRKSDLKGSLVDVRIPGSEFRGLRISLAGSFQIRNAILALRTLDEVRRTQKFNIPDRAIRSGFAAIQTHSGLRGRLSIVKNRPLVLVDVAHNRDAMRTLCRSLKELKLRRLRVVFGVMKDKDYRSMVRSLGTIATEVFVVEATTERSRLSSDIAAALEADGTRATLSGGVPDGVRMALDGASQVPVLVTGSHFVVGEALAFLEKKKYLTISQ